jgi:hypothetical protein
VYCCWRSATEALAAQGLQHQGLLRLTQCQGRAGAYLPWHCGGPTKAVRCARAWCRAGAPRHRPMARHAAALPRAGASSCVPAIKDSRTSKAARVAPTKRQLFFEPR